MLALFLRWKKS